MVKDPEDVLMGVLVGGRECAEGLASTTWLGNVSSTRHVPEGKYEKTGIAILCTTPISINLPDGIWSIVQRDYHQDSTSSSVHFR